MPNDTEHHATIPASELLPAAACVLTAYRLAQLNDAVKAARKQAKRDRATVPAWQELADAQADLRNSTTARRNEIAGLRLAAVQSTEGTPAARHLATVAEKRDELKRKLAADVRDAAQMLLPFAPQVGVQV